MSRTPRSDGGLALGETAAIVVLAATGLVVVGAASMVSALMNRIWPGASRIGPLNFDPQTQIPPDDDAPHPQTPPGLGT